MQISLSFLKLLQRYKLQEDLINSYENSINECRELSELFELAMEEKNQIVLNDTLKSFDKLKLKTKRKDT